MLIDLKVKNCYAFNDEVKLSLKADMRTKKFTSNIINLSNHNLLKSVGIYGSNNTGKTCLISIFAAFKNILLNKKHNLKANIFNNTSICEIAATFIEDDHTYNYQLKYNSDKFEYIYERFEEIIYDEHKNAKEQMFFLRDTEKDEYLTLNDNQEFLQAINYASKDNILIYSLNVDKISLLKEIKNTLTNFANRLQVISMEHLDMNKTIKILKTNDASKTALVNFIKNADLYLEDFKYDATKYIPSEFEDLGELKEQFKLVSVYKGKEMPSIQFDSLGTKKIAALAGYLIEAIKTNQILIVDEINSSIHFKLTRAIVSLFNNDLNTNSQLIFTTHDINLMDIKTLLRKEQIWFTHKDKSRTYLYSLADFTAEKNGIRDTSDIIEKYTKGFLGAIPDPKLIDSLVEILDE